jgi:hypothetical protein
MEKIKVFSVPWHQAHQSELLKIDWIDWTYCINHIRKFDARTRPIPKHLKWVPYYEPGKYDLAILHVDQQCLIPSLGKAQLFRQLASQITDIPIIVINHGTPVYPEMFMQMCVADGYPANEDSAIKWARDKMFHLMKEYPNIVATVVNSHQAKEQWGGGEAIIHGLDKEEWLDKTKDPRVATFISAAGIGDKYYGRILFQETRDILKSKYGMEIIWIAQDAMFNSFEDYKEFMSHTLIYFNPTLASPMPRTRTEAMFSGSCLVTTRHQDVESFIEDGVNGYICKDNPEDAADKIAYAMEHYKETVAIGQRGKETAMKIFSAERFRNDWKNLVEKVLNKKIS